MGKLIELTGQKFGRLTVVEKVKSAFETRAFWLCACDCGKSHVSSGRNLRSGITRSCGCLMVECSRAMGSNPENIKKRAAKATRHGHKRRGQMSVEYRTWLAMKRRCSDVKCKDYPNWGGRGVRVSTEWDCSFDNFLSDMGYRPMGHSIDRIDPNGNYSKDNCRWAPMTEQNSKNKRTLVPVTIDGISYPSISAAAKVLGVKKTSLFWRLKNNIPQGEISTKGRLNRWR